MVAASVAPTFGCSNALQVLSIVSNLRAHVGTGILFHPFWQLATRPGVLFGLRMDSRAEPGEEPLSVTL